MSQSNHMDRRKVQNREAQRRFRRKQKDLAHENANETDSHDSRAGSTMVVTSQDGDIFREVNFLDTRQTTSNSPHNFTANSKLRNDSGAASTSSPSKDWCTSQFGDAFEPFQSVVSNENTPHNIAMPHHPDYALEFFARNIMHDSTGAVPTGCESKVHSSSESTSETGASLPRSYANFHDKVVQMSEELVKVYEFGVEIQLVQPNDLLYQQIIAIKRQFSKSIHKAAEMEFEG